MMISTEVKCAVIVHNKLSYIRGSFNIFSQNRTKIKREPEGGHWQQDPVGCENDEN